MEKTLNILDLIERTGWFIFPLKPNSRYFYKGFPWKEKSTNSLKVIKDWLKISPNSNWGIDCGKSGILVVDIDVKKGKEGFRTVEKLKKEGLIFPESFKIATPSLGGHIYYNDPGKYGRNTVDFLGPGIDTRGKGGLVVAPFSKIEAGEYKIIDDRNAVLLPDWIKDALTRENNYEQGINRNRNNNPSLLYDGIRDSRSNWSVSDVGNPKNCKKVGIRHESNKSGVSGNSINSSDSKIRSARDTRYSQNYNSDRNSESDNESNNGDRDLRANVGKKTDIDIDRPDYIIEAVKYLKEAPISKEGEGGDTNAYKTACEIRDRGISEETCLNLLLSFWNERCLPPWSYEELRRKTQNAYKYAESSEGKATPQKIFKEALPAPIKEDIFKEIQTFDSLIKVEPPLRQWIIQDWLPARNASFFTGVGGSGKSIIAMQLAAAVASGVDWLGLPVITAMPTIAILCEDSAEEIHRRAFAIGGLPEYRLAPDSVTAAPFKAEFISRLGKNNTLGIVQDSIRPGVFFTELEKILDRYKGRPKLLILDTITDVFKGNENDRIAVNQFVKEVLGRLVLKHDCAILSIGHPPKDSAKEYSGSTGWDTAHRQRIFLKYHENVNLPDHRILERSKANYARKGERLFLQYREGAYISVSQADIHDEIEEENLKILFSLIKEYAYNNKPLGLHHQAKYYLKHVEVKDAAGIVLNWETKKRLTQGLMTRNKIEEASGQARKNGLWPLEEKY